MPGLQDGFPRLPFRLGCRWQVVCGTARIRRNLQPGRRFLFGFGLCEGQLVSHVRRSVAVRVQVRRRAVAQASACLFSQHGVGGVRVVCAV